MHDTIIDLIGLSDAFQLQLMNIKEYQYYIIQKYSLAKGYEYLRGYYYYRIQCHIPATVYVNQNSGIYFRLQLREHL